MKQSKGILLLKQKETKKWVLAMCIVLAMGVGTAVQAQERISKQTLIGEWQFVRVVLEEKSGQYTKPKTSTFTELDSVQKVLAYPFFYTVTSLIIMPDGMNLNTIELSLLDAPFDVRTINGNQMLEVEDNRPEDQREQATLVYAISLKGKLMKLSGKYLYTNAEGQSVEGILTTTLQRL